MVKEGEGFSGANYLKQRRSGLIARREKGEAFVYLFGALVDVKLGIFYILFAMCKGSEFSDWIEQFFSDQH